MIFSRRRAIGKPAHLIRRGLGLYEPTLNQPESKAGDSVWTSREVLFDSNSKVLLCLAFWILYSYCNGVNFVKQLCTERIHGVRFIKPPAARACRPPKGSGGIS